MFTGALAYLNGQMTEADLVAILTYRGGAVRVKQDFTDDRVRWRNVIDVLANGEDADGDGELDFQDFSRHSARTTASSTSSPPTGSWRRCRRR